MKSRISVNGIEVSSVLHNDVNDSSHFNRKDEVKKQLHERFRSDRKDLSTWANIPIVGHWSLIDSFSEWHQYHLKIGGAETISLKIQNALLDKDNDGNISEEEIKQSEEQRTETVNQALSLLTTAGVVGALLASIMTPLLLSPVIPSSESEEYFEPKTLKGFSFLYRILLTLSLGFSFMLIGQSSRKYLQLSFWMPNLEMKTWYLSEVSLIPIIRQQKQAIFFAMFALPFGVAVLVTPVNGLIVLVVVLYISISAWIDDSFGKGDLFVIKAMHNYTRSAVLNMKICS